ncbi:MAG: MOSC domain-containing protein [Rhizobiaceae bacterium]|nr:MOSC domain-containing protein [Rhizobiaceae bacterium]
MLTLKELTSRHAQSGVVECIGLRPNRRSPLTRVDSAIIDLNGLQGDHYSGTGKRAITLIQYEHLPVIAALLAREEVDSFLLRRNIVISGINLLSLRGTRFKIGSAELEGTGICAPCSRMEEVFGHGGYNAVRGHGGITAKVVKSGAVAVGEKVFAIKSA